MRARWEQILEGKRSKTPGGLYDAHIILAQRFHWDQQTVDAQDAAYVDELTCFWMRSLPSRSGSKGRK
jgi:hypothetical protein